MEKQTLREDTNKKLINTSQAQINDLKERFVLVEKTLANSTQEIYANIQGGINEVVKQITEEKWKDLVSKMRTVLEKEEEVLLKKVERKFAPISLINDLDMTIERVDALENQSILREE